MALHTETVDLAAERERLREKMDEVAAKQVEWQGNPEKAQQLLEVGQRLNNQINILEWAEDGWGVESITFGCLSEGERNFIDQFCDDHPDVAERVPYVALGTHDAPYLAHDPDDIGAPDFDADFEATVHTLVSDVPIPFVEWAESKVGETSFLEGREGNGYLELVREKQAKTSDETAGGTTAEQPPSPTDTPRSR